MNDKDLRKRIEELYVRNVSFELWQQIETKGSPNHRIIGPGRQFFYMYAHPKECGGFPFNPDTTTYRQLEKKHPKEFEKHFRIIKECAESGFQI